MRIMKTLIFLVIFLMVKYSDSSDVQEFLYENYKSSLCVNVVSDNDKIIRYIINNIPVYLHTKSSYILTNDCTNFIIDLENTTFTFNLFLNNKRLVKHGKYIIFVYKDYDKLIEYFIHNIYLNVQILTTEESNVVKQYGVYNDRNGLVNLNGRKLNVTAFHNPPFSVYKDGKYDGVEVRIIRVLSELLNFTIDMHVPYDGHLWGQEDINGNWNGLKGELARGQTDIGIALLYMNKIHSEIFQLSYPYTRACVTFLVPAPEKLLNNWNALLKPFKIQLWFLLIFLLFLHSFILYFISNQKLSICKCVIETIRISTLSSAVLKGTEPFCQKILFITWIISCFLIAGLYSSELSSWLVTQTSIQKYKTLDDIATKNIKWGRLDSDLADLLLKSPNEIYQKVGLKFELELSEEDINMKVMNGDYAIVVHILSDGYPSGGEFLTKKARDKLVTLSECVSIQFISIGLSKELPIGDAVNKALKQLDTAGLLQEWQARDVTIYGDGAIYKQYIRNNHITFSAFTLNNLASAFTFYILANLFAILIFIIEIIKKKA